jgi:hypothetical protein
MIPIRRIVVSHQAASLKAFDPLVVRLTLRQRRCCEHQTHRVGHRGREQPCPNHRDPQPCQVLCFFVLKDAFVRGAYYSSRSI